jgi:hypothetical protein
MYRIASRTVALYWRKHYQHRNGLTCGNCSKSQRKACKENWLYGSCPKAISLESLDRPVIDSEGNMTDLGNLIADDKALDLEAWTDARTFLLSCPDRLVGIAGKMRDSEALTGAERNTSGNGDNTNKKFYRDLRHDGSIHNGQPANCFGEDVNSKTG